MKIKIILILMLVMAIYFYGYYNSETLILEKNITLENVKYVVNGTECASIQHYKISDIEYIPKTINITMDLTLSQEEGIKNLKPKKCNNIGCSEGYIKCKYDVFDILGYDKPKFSEKPSIGYDPNPINHEFLPVKNDSYGKYIELDKELWMVYNYASKDYDINIMLENKTLYQNLTFLIDTLIEKNVKCSIPSKGNNIIIRRI